MRLLCVICGLLTSVCVGVCGNPDCPRMPVRDLALRAGVVLEGVMEESLQKPGYETETRMDGVRRETREGEPVAKLEQSRIRVYRVWEIKTRGIQKDAVVFIMWPQESMCFQMKPGTRYVFFTEPTGDASVLRALFPPVQSKRAVRKDITHALCQSCATPKLKKLTNVEVEEGQKVALKCELLAGGKQTKIQWYQNGKKVVKSETRKIKLKKNRAISELLLTKVTDADVGTYTCTAVNERGEDSQNASVQVIKAHEEDGHLQFLDILSMTTRLFCWLSSSTTTALLICSQVLAVLRFKLAKPRCATDLREGSTPGFPVYMPPESAIIYRLCCVSVLQ
ncbi:Pro-neuregulin-2, membrane-bound isoform [Bagarius yarrelli]|uniref:Pro-neuregulin-2, membrane-bound isoform n=1 Tax=Bagarius yarrelli TaxID=175774 RepID=A0A556V294_BAGYA|nr:Pro-neuregulin-2, membrane-bound isoform [Bagarius yarrelli]